MSAAVLAQRIGAIVQGRFGVVVVVCIAVFALFFPARQLAGQRSDMEALETRLAAIAAENERLAAEVARLEDPAQLETLARERLGLVRPGEDAYLFVEPPPTGPERATDEAPSVFERAWGWLVSLVRGSG